MFEKVTQAPADAILGLTEAFKKDTHPDKINLGIGVYTDANGKTPLLECVQVAEKRLFDAAAPHTYLPIDGDALFCASIQKLVFGAESEIVTSKRAFTAAAPGGTGALRVAFDFIKANLPVAKVWISSPTWPNHPQVIAASGIETMQYPWFDASANALDFAGLTVALEKIPSGDAILLHACCHNPTGIDPTAEQWEKIAKILSTRGILPVVDFAYQGFGDGLDEDATGVRILARSCPEMLVCSSCSKNFSLYSDRVGAATFVTKDAETAVRTGSQVKRVIRSNYSNPPQHGFMVVRTILSDKELTAMWHEELARMRNRINSMRTLFADTLAAKGVQQDFGFIKRQRGMFSFSGLNKTQVQTLKEKYSIYIVGSGRICVAAMNERTMNPLCEAIKSVL